MRHRLLGCLCLLLAASPVAAQSRENASAKATSPPKMFSYLAEGMRVGIRSIEGTASITISVYTEEDYELARATKKPVKALSEPGVKRALSAYMKRNGLDDSAAARISVVPPMRTVFGRIAVIADDYLLIGLDDDIKSERGSTSRRRRIIPKWSIGSIDLDANPIRFVTHPERTRTPARG